MIPVKKEIVIGRLIPLLELRHHDDYRDFPKSYRQEGKVHEAKCFCGKIFLVHINRLPKQCKDAYNHRSEKQVLCAYLKNIDNMKNRINFFKQLHKKSIRRDQEKIEIRIQELEKELQLLKEAPIP